MPTAAIQKAQGLYTASDLLKGYDRGDPASFIASYDYKTFIDFVAHGGPVPDSREVASRQAEHDAQMSLSLRAYLKTQTPEGQDAPKLVAIMGGHILDRDAPAYTATAGIARDLTQRGFLVVTGGGPGAMEAGHAGAYFANAPDSVHRAALEVLRRCPVLPKDLGNIIDPKTGAIIPHQDAAYVHAASWLNAALDAKELLPDGTAPGESIAIPTWLYGTEPTTPFASVYAKYFQNSIREETLVAEGKTGTIYARGSGGTLREVFQGVEHNCYIQDVHDFLPMIFVDPDNYWDSDPVFGEDGKPTVQAINMKAAIGPILEVSIPDLWPQCKDKVQFTTDLATIWTVLGGERANRAGKAQQYAEGRADNIPGGAIQRTVVNWLNDINDIASIL